MLVFEEDVINRYLQCPLCQVRYDEPRTLPCGKTVCNGCLKLMEVSKLNENLRQLKCKACGEVHILSKTELGTNEFVKVFLDETLTSKDIYRGKAAEAFKLQLREMKSELDYFEASNRDKIRGHCEALRREIEREANSLVEFIEVSSNGFLKQIDEYEEECIAEYESKSGKPDERVQGEFVRDVRDFHEEWAAYLRRLLIDDDEIVKATDLARAHQRRLQEQKKKLDTLIYNGSVLRYQKSEREPRVEEILGSLVLDPIETPVEQVAAAAATGNKINLSNKLAAGSSSAGFLDDQSDFDDIFKNFTGEFEDEQPDAKPDTTSQAAFMKELKEKINDKSRKTRDAVVDVEGAETSAQGIKIEIETDPHLGKKPAQSPQQDELLEKLQQEQEAKLKKNKEMQQRYLLEKQQRQMQQQQQQQPGVMEIYTEETTNITEMETVVENYRTNPAPPNLKIEDVSVLLSQNPAQARPTSPQSRLPPAYSEVPAYPHPTQNFGYTPQGFSRRQSKSLLMDMDAAAAADPRGQPAPSATKQVSGKSKLPVLSSPNLSQPDQYLEEPDHLELNNLSSSSSKISSSPNKTNLNRRVLNLIRRKNKKHNNNNDT